MAAVFPWLDRLIPGLAAGIILVVMWEMLTGGIHLDGLADTADGLFSRRPRERKLEIMRDSRIGAMGAAALWAVLALKSAALAAVPPPVIVPYVVFAAASGRWAMVWAITFFPYARAEGAGSIFHGERLLPAAAAASLFWAAAGLWLLRLPGALIILPAVVLLNHMLCIFLKSRLGGLTGDTYGALCQVMEVWVLLLGSVLTRML